RDRRDELRVVAAAGLLVRVGPAPVEDELAAGVVLHVERHRADEAAVRARRDVGRLPARARPDAAGSLERDEKLVAQERVSVRQRVPVARLDTLEGIEA